jgi:hypothetical protein
VTSPIRTALRARSPLQSAVCEGLGALEKPHKQLIEAAVRTTFVDSLEIDEGLRKGNDTANRWDYLLGHGESSVIVAFEPHSAATGDATTVIAKKKAAQIQLREHLKPGARVAAWMWVASGRVDFVPHDRVLRRLDQEGITFVGGMLKAKHLVNVGASPKSRRW